MTPPRRHIAGQIAMMTRRCCQRRYFLRPDDYINDVLPFEVGKAAERHGQYIYGAVSMSNHVHFAVGDSTGDRSDFMKDAMSGIARARNCNLDRKGHFWESGSFGDTVLLNKDAIERKLLYIWLNPVRAGLVDRAEDWPGFKILPRDWGKTIRIEKPDQFYGRRNPDAVEFTPKPPPGYDDMTLEEVKKYFQNLLRQKEDEILAERRRKNVTCAGREKILATKPFEMPDTEDVSDGINPRFACKDGKLLASATATYRAFRDRYETRRQRWLKGKKVTFPAGTVKLRKKAPIKCASPPENEPALFAAD